MGQVNVSLPSDGSTADVSDYNTPITTIVDEINGNLDNSNISASAAIAGSKLASGGVGTTQLADGAVTPAKILAGTGTSWPWQSWTPTLSGRFDNTKWTKDCTYVQIGKTVFFKLNLTANTTTPMSGGSADAIFTLPVTSIDYGSTDQFFIGAHGRILDFGTAAFSILAAWRSTTTAHVRLIGASSTYATDVAITSTAPMTWTTNDQITIFGQYEAA